MTVHGAMTVAEFHAYEVAYWGNLIPKQLDFVECVNWLASRVTANTAASILQVKRTKIVSTQHCHEIVFKQPDGLGKRIQKHDAFSDGEDLLANYWAGFLSADGHLTPDGIRICLHIRDEEHLQSAMTFVDYRGHLSYSIKRPSRKRVAGETSAWGIYCELAFNSSPILKDLSRHWSMTGTKVDRPFRHLPSSIEARAAFLPGITDGDGSINKEGSATIATASKEAAERLADVARTVCKIPATARGQVHLKRRKNTYVVVIPKRGVEQLQAFGVKRHLPLLTRKLK